MRAAIPATVMAAFLAAAACAWAGGVPSSIATDGVKLWTCSDAGLIELDGVTGRVLARPIVGSSYPLHAAVGGGAAWVAGVENGYGSGSLTRLDLRSGGRLTVRGLRHEPVTAVATGAGFVWALVGPTVDARVARISTTGRLLGFVRGSTKPSWLAADGSGVWIVDEDGWLLHARPQATRAVRVVRARGQSWMPAAGSGSVWVPDGRSVVRVDERSGKIVARVRLPGGPLALAVDAGSTWVVAYRPSARMWLLRIGLDNRIRGRRRIPLETASVAAAGGRVWLGLTGRSPRVLTVDARTLRLRLLARLL